MNTGQLLFWKIVIGGMAHGYSRLPGRAYVKYTMVEPKGEASESVYRERILIGGTEKRSYSESIPAYPKKL